MVVAAALRGLVGSLRSCPFSIVRPQMALLLLASTLLVAMNALAEDEQAVAPAALTTPAAEAGPAIDVTAAETPTVAETEAVILPEGEVAVGVEVEVEVDATADPGVIYEDEEFSDEISSWQDRVQALMLDIELGQRGPDDADRLYAELSAEFWPMQSTVHRAIHDDAPDLIEQHAELVELYELRSQLFAQISPSLRLNLTSLDDLGRGELGRELDYLSANIEYQQHILQTALDHLEDSVTEAPSATFTGIVEILAGLFAFRLWRRWAREGIPAWRRSLLAARPRTRSSLRLARLLWYLERIRGPVEWLVLIWFISLVIHPAGFEELASLISTFVKWLLIGFLAVRIIDAMAARGAAGMGRDRSGLRLKSLRLTGYWSILLGLVLDFTGRYAGTGVVHAWIVRGWLVLSVPMLLVLVHWWRPVIFERLSEQSEPSSLAAKITARPKGLVSYVGATAGGALLLWDGLLRLLVRALSASEFGRRMIAVLVRREVARDIERERHTEETPIADEIILPLIAARDVLIEEITRDELKLLVSSIEAHGGGSSMVIGERGAGKTIFLERVAAALGGTMRIIDCPVGRWESFEQALGSAFDVELGDGFAGRLASALEREGVHAIGVDNFHHLPRPERGGQSGIQQLGELNEALDQALSWVFAVDRHAWSYILRAGADRAMLHQVITLPTWTEEQLAELVDRRGHAIGIEPDYGRLVLPRQLDAGDHEDAEDRNRFGYARVLWELADGNPEVSLYLFAESLRRTLDGSIILRLPQLRTASSLNDAQPDALLVLRALIQCDVASVDDVAHNVRLSGARVRAILQFCVRNEWIVETDRGYRVSWRWFRSVTRALVRQNLMGR